MIKNVTMAGTVTIKSADSAHDAVFSDIRIANAAGFTFNDVDVHRPLAAGEAEFTQAVYVSGSSRIAFVGVDFTGSLDNNAWNDGVGLRVSSSSDIRLVDSTFEQWTNSATFDHVSRLTVAGNSVTAVREGFDFAAVHDVVIDRNLFTKFTPNYAAGDHSDAIQFWNTGVKEGSSHVEIADNIILQGANGGTQGIFIRNEDPNPAYRHSDFTIENNLYNGDARSAITVAGLDNSVIRGNTVTSAPGGALEAGINLSDTKNVTVDHNIAPLLLSSGSNPGAIWSNNIDLWDSKTKAGVALDSVFAVKSGATGFDVAAYALKAGGAAALAHTGFAMVDGIGAAAFDVGHLAGYAHLDGLAGAIAVI